MTAVHQNNNKKLFRLPSTYRLGLGLLLVTLGSLVLQLKCVSVYLNLSTSTTKTVPHSIWQHLNSNNKLILRSDTSSTGSQQHQLLLPQDDADEERCAILFFGLPRAFESLVLPSLRKHVIRPNNIHTCDYFVHYYDQTSETAGRSGGGGTIDTHQIRLLEQAVHQEEANDNSQGRRRKSKVHFISDTEDAFWQQYRTFTQKLRTTNITTVNPQSNVQESHPLYWPYKARTYKDYTTMDNIIKMWHSIQSAWKLMESHENAAATHTNRFHYYSRVAVLRSDVVYVTPVDIYQVHVAGKTHTIGPTSNDVNAKVTVLPGFGRFPVNDRSVMGPRAAVQVWAAERFANLEAHAKMCATDTTGKKQGWALHSEKFVGWTIVPLMRSQGQAKIVDDDALCFLRARADESVWISDCKGADAGQALPHILERIEQEYGTPSDKINDEEHARVNNKKKTHPNDMGNKPMIRAVEAALGRPCHKVPFKVSFSVRGLWCPQNFETATPPLEWAPQGRKRKPIV